MRSQDNSIEFYIIVAFVAYLIIAPIAIFVYEKLKLVIVYIHKRLAVCPHGVSGGENFNLCDLCRQVKEKAAKQLEHERAERERKADIQKRAMSLYSAEVEKFKKEQLKKLDYLVTITPEEFEDYIALLFSKLGYKVEQTPYVNDGGKDAIALKDGKKYLIECKRYGINKTIGRPQLQKFFAAMIEEKAVKGFFVNTGQYTKTAYEYAANNNIELINGEELVKLVQQAFTREDDSNSYRVMCLECGEIICFNSVNLSDGKFCPNGHLVKNNLIDYFNNPDIAIKSKVCKLCGKEMELKIGKRGKFWGCKGFPSCRHTESYGKIS